MTVSNLRRQHYMSQPNIVTISPEVMSGAPVFRGTRVPVQNLLDYLKAGDSIDDFLDGFPTVSREQVLAFLVIVTVIVGNIAIGV